jgi:phage gp29-like protein
MPATLPIARVTSRNLKPIEEAIPVHTSRQARASGSAQPQYLAQQLDVNRIQAALRAAERGDTWQYFTIIRDMISGYAHLGAEWTKRKSVIVGQPYSLIPYDKGNKDDIIAAGVIKEMIDNCRNWREGCLHLLDATLMPLSAAEKIYEPVDASANSRFKFPVRMKLKEIAPIDYILLCFKIPYLNYLKSANSNEASVYNPDRWENWLTFYKTQPNGSVDYSPGDVYEPDPEVHIIHRGNILCPSIPPNFGGQIRAILFWWLLATQDRDWWAIMMQKYGSPFILGKADVQQMDTVTFLQQAFSMATQIGGLVIDKKADAELIQANATDGSNSHKIFNDYCNCEVSKVVVGQVLSSTPKNTGLGSGMADQAESVREDIRTADQTNFSDTLQKQLFEQYLRINGYAGRPPKIFWGGIKVGDATLFTKSLAQAYQGGYRIPASHLSIAEEKLGFPLEFVPEPAVKPEGRILKNEE